MKTTLTFAGALMMAVAVSATPIVKNYYTIAVDERGNGFIGEYTGNGFLNIQPLSFSTSIADPFVEAHPDNPPTPNPLTLSYALPATFGGLNLSRLTAGDVIIYDTLNPAMKSADPAPKSAMLRIGSNGRLYFYSNSDTGSSNQDPADVGVPINTQLITTILAECSVAGFTPAGMVFPNDSSGINYVPIKGQAGYTTNSIVSFYIVNSCSVPSIPEPSTWVAGALMAATLGMSVVRKFLRS